MEAAGAAHGTQMTGLEGKEATVCGEVPFGVGADGTRVVLDAASSEAVAHRQG